ncbi:hypothetical protein ACHAXT_005614 [Thalassiosira profunda]
MSSGAHLLRQLQEQRRRQQGDAPRPSGIDPNPTKTVDADNRAGDPRPIENGESTGDDKRRATIEVCLGPDCAGGGGGAALLEIEDLVCKSSGNNNIAARVVDGGCRDRCTVGPNVYVTGGMGGEAAHFVRVNSPEACRRVVRAVAPTNSSIAKEASVAERILLRREDGRRWRALRERAAAERRLRAQERIPKSATTMIVSLLLLLLSARPAGAFAQCRAVVHRLSSSRRSSVQTEGDGDDSPGGARLFSEQLNIIFDSKCSVCQLEVDYLQSRMDNHFGGEPLIRFTDLEAEAGYDEGDPANGNVTYEMGMRSFHAVKPDGEILHGVPVFRAAYEIVDQAWVFEATTYPIIGPLAAWGYELFAKVRTLLTRGSAVEDLIEDHYRQKVEQGGYCLPCRSKIETEEQSTS